MVKLIFTNFQLEIIALDKRTYETRDTTLEIEIHPNENNLKYQVQLKSHNWNVDDMFDNNRTESLLDVFR